MGDEDEMMRILAECLEERSELDQIPRSFVILHAEEPIPEPEPERRKRQTTQQLPMIAR